MKSMSSGWCWWALLLLAVLASVHARLNEPAQDKAFTTGGGLFNSTASTPHFGFEPNFTTSPSQDKDPEGDYSSAFHHCYNSKSLDVDPMAICSCFDGYDATKFYVHRDEIRQCNTSKPFKTCLDDTKYNYAIYAECKCLKTIGDVDDLLWGYHSKYWVLESKCINDYDDDYTSSSQSKSHDSTYHHHYYNDDDYDSDSYSRKLVLFVILAIVVMVLAVGRQCGYCRPWN